MYLLPQPQRASLQQGSAALLQYEKQGEEHQCVCLSWQGSSEGPVRNRGCWKIIQCRCEHPHSSDSMKVSKADMKEKENTYFYQRWTWFCSKLACRAEQQPAKKEKSPLRQQCQHQHHRNGETFWGEEGWNRHKHSCPTAMPHFHIRFKVLIYHKIFG